MRRGLPKPLLIAAAALGLVAINLAGGAADDGTILLCFDFASKPVVESSS